MRSKGPKKAETTAKLEQAHDLSCNELLAIFISCWAYFFFFESFCLPLAACSFSFSTLSGMLGNHDTGFRLNHGQSGVQS